jgi:hypothetical protein
MFFDFPQDPDPWTTQIWDLGLILLYRRTEDFEDAVIMPWYRNQVSFPIFILFLSYPPLRSSHLLSLILYLPFLVIFFRFFFTFSLIFKLQLLTAPPHFSCAFHLFISVVFLLAREIDCMFPS